ncbi:MAG: cytochrome c biogenesis protein CcsA [Phycisphaerales bacterium]|nr:cytochrome c biogenesis protein CcsA [Phycisphaerales bacterium]
MFRRLLLVTLWCLALLPSLSRARAADADPGIDRLGALAVQDGGRVMPLEGFARRFAVDVTGRSRWSSGGPEGFTKRSSMQLLLDCMFDGKKMLNTKVVTIEDKPFKKLIGLDPERRFFSPVELANCAGLAEQLNDFEKARQSDPGVSPTKDQRKALDVRNAANRIADYSSGMTLPIIPSGPGQAFRHASALTADPGAEAVQAAFKEIGQLYTAGQPITPAVEKLESAINAMGALTEKDARNVKLELFYDKHDPWRMTAYFYGLALVFFGFSRLFMKNIMVTLALTATLLGIGEHVLGVVLRVMILDRAPVSNTFESLLWMGLVGIAIGLVFQLVNKRRGYYLFGGVAAAFISVLFAGLVPLTDRTNSLPAVLRSNFWLIIHVLTIVASYGVLAVSAVLGHAYLIKDVILNKRDEASRLRSAALVVQTYRTIQVGLILLTAGTILGGVWAAESWGRFWGWDPKETWALISILVYFAVLHARYVRWIEDFGLAASAVLGMVVIVWTFYGVNYVMATGLHSYGFGSGGEVWVGLWAALELLFLAVCWVRSRSLKSAAALNKPQAA